MRKQLHKTMMVEQANQTSRNENNATGSPAIVTKDTTLRVPSIQLSNSLQQ